MKRFKVGDRVLARVNGWAPGTVTQLDYREDDWDAGKPTSPYQILLDARCRDGHEQYVHAPYDDDEVIRALPNHPQALSDALDHEQVTCTNTGKLCPLYHVCDDNIHCRSYHFCGKLGVTKTRLWKKLAQRQQQQRHNERVQTIDTNLCSDCDNGACEDRSELTIDAILAFVEGTGNDDTKQSSPHQSLACSHQRKPERPKKTHRTTGRKTQTKNQHRSNNTHARKTTSPVSQPPLSTLAIDNGDGSDRDHKCTCDCHDIVQLGRTAVVAKLQEGVDFSSLFREDLFEVMDEDQQCELEEFERRLQGQTDFELRTRMQRSGSRSEID
eukprot:m.201243 g.201243  ORF g.201243 m.201243 type:complete len:327 (+) comp21362_c0_seq1:199-1179(+)